MKDVKIGGLWSRGAVSTTVKTLVDRGMWDYSGYELLEPSTVQRIAINDLTVPEVDIWLACEALELFDALYEADWLYLRADGLRFVKPAGPRIDDNLNDEAIGPVSLNGRYLDLGITHIALPESVHHWFKGISEAVVGAWLHYINHPKVRIPLFANDGDAENVSQFVVADLDQARDRLTAESAIAKQTDEGMVMHHKFLGYYWARSSESQNPDNSGKVIPLGQIRKHG